jgi:glycerol-3-phosphate acyltransferase PlsY
MWGSAYGLGDATVAAVALAAFLGHLFPVFFHFKGGKGVATAAGVLFGVDWLLGLLTLAAWVAVVALSRMSSLGAIAAAVFAPVCFMFGVASGPITGAIAVMSILLVWRHSDNIGRLLQGKESKLGSKKS